MSSSNIHIESFYAKRKDDVSAINKAWRDANGIVSRKRSCSVDYKGKDKGQDHQLIAEVDNRHSYRRTTSYRPYRISRRRMLGGAAVVGFSKLGDGLGEMGALKKRLKIAFESRCREHKRRPSLYIKQDSTYLPTHMWLVKRMQMKMLWGFRVPLFHRLRGIKALGRALTGAAVLSDESFMRPIEVSANQDSLERLLQMVSDCFIGDSYGHDEFWGGGMELRCHFYRRSEFPSGLLGPAHICLAPRKPPTTEIEKETTEETKGLEDNDEEKGEKEEEETCY